MIVNMIIEMKYVVSFLPVDWLECGAASAHSPVKSPTQAARNPSLGEDSDLPSAQRTGLAALSFKTTLQASLSAAIVADSLE